jgi:peroxiredoxin Q/BCP
MSMPPSKSGLHATSVRRMTRGNSMCAVPVFVLAPGHNLDCALRFAMHAYVSGGRTKTGRGSRHKRIEPVAPLPRKWHARHDRWKATKGRHMARDLVAGAKAPPFMLPRDGGSKVSLKDFKGSNLVLYFYPRADTPGCTKEAIAFSRLRGDFAKAGTAILGVSADPVAAQDKFKSKHKLSIALGSDETKKMLTAYGAWGEKSMYGRKFMGVIRKTFLIDAAGRIVRIWPKVSVAGHA